MMNPLPDGTIQRKNWVGYMRKCISDTMVRIFKVAQLLDILDKYFQNELPPERRGIDVSTLSERLANIPSGGITGWNSNADKTMYYALPSTSALDVIDQHRMGPHRVVEMLGGWDYSNGGDVFSEVTGAWSECDTLTPSLLSLQYIKDGQILTGKNSVSSRGEHYRHQYSQVFPSILHEKCYSNVCKADILQKINSGGDTRVSDVR